MQYDIEATVQIGKQGITETIIKDIKLQLKKKKTIKVKFLSSAITSDKKQLARELAERANAKLLSHVGFTVILGRK
ncbi:RNA-binding protein [Candidatus Woesearchaeota archaeon CG10_big_fil_rev_8_21_14_0_10_37_12]|nr:MAG: RNA-binding protein [Candidatus Woesearchaeota archaeon CG10_big_fil_rev_8_21_14_0_10_37_12]